VVGLLDRLERLERVGSLVADGALGRRHVYKGERERGSKVRRSQSVRPETRREEKRSDTKRSQQQRERGHHSHTRARARERNNHHGRRGARASRKRHVLKESGDGVGGTNERTVREGEARAAEREQRSEPGEASARTKESTQGKAGEPPEPFYVCKTLRGMNSGARFSPVLFDRSARSIDPSTYLPLARSLQWLNHALHHGRRSAGAVAET